MSSRLPSITEMRNASKYVNAGCNCFIERIVVRMQSLGKLDFLPCHDGGYTHYHYYERAEQRRGGKFGIDDFRRYHLLHSGRIEAHYRIATLPGAVSGGFESDS